MKYKPCNSFLRGVLLSMAWGLIASTAKNQYGWGHALTILALVNWIVFSIDMLLEGISKIWEIK
jgi:hypothetical protein